jgi:hypothetical protein
MVAFVTVATQVLKHFIKGVDPKWFALAVAGVAVGAVQGAFPDGFTFENAFLAVANTLIVTGAAIGLFEGSKSIGKVLRGDNSK